MFEYVVPRDGEAGFCLVAEPFLVVVADGLQSSIPRLWPRLTEPGGRLEEVFEALAGPSVGTAPAFAIAEIIDVAAREVRVIVHGDAVAQVPGDPTARITAAGLATWREASWRDGDGVMIGLHGAGPAGVGTLPITGGVVRADWVRWRPTAPTAVAARDDRATAAQPTVRTGGAPRDDDGDRTGHRAPAGLVPAIRLEEGPPLGLELPIVLGRQPTPGRSGSGTPTVPVVVPSPRRLVSARHLLVERVGESVRLHDLGTRNGSLVRTPDGATHALRDGAALTVPIGTRVDLSDEARLEVVAAPPE